MTLSAGTKLGSYEILSLLGRKRAEVAQEWRLLDDPEARISSRIRGRAWSLLKAVGQVTILPVIMGIMKERVLSASEFKARCLACLGEIEQYGEPITITRRGRPVAVLGPAKRNALKSPRNSWARRGRIVADIVNLDTSALWEVAGE